MNGAYVPEYHKLKSVIIAKFELGSIILGIPICFPLLHVHFLNECLLHVFLSFLEKFIDMHYINIYNHQFNELQHNKN